MTPTWDGRTPLQQLIEISARVPDMIARQESIFIDEILPALAVEGVSIVAWDDLSADDRTAMREYYDARIFPC